MSVTLAQIEQEVARRCGPFRIAVATSGTQANVVSNELASAIDQGGYENLYLLRRGVDNTGAAIVGFAAGDRLRGVSTTDISTGTLTVDRAWTNAPVANEQFELHHLDPTNELRPAVLAGLKRCFYIDRLTVALTGAAAERDLTTLLPSLVERSQIYEVEWIYPNGLWTPRAVMWFRTFTLGGHVWLGSYPDPYPNTLLVTIRLTNYSQVNGAYAAGGPTLDADTMDVVLEYAAAAGHIEAWRLFPHRLKPVADLGLQMPQQAVATEFSRQAATHFRPPKRRVQLTKPFDLLGRMGMRV